MIEISAVKVVADLFKDAIALVQKRRQNEREMFEQTFRALFDRLEPVAKEYYAAVSDARLKLNDPEPNFTAIFDDLEPKRSSLILARNGFIGEAEALHEAHNLETNRKFDEFGKLAIGFLTSIFRYFEEVHLTEAERHDLLESGDLNPGAGGKRFRRILPRSALTSFMRAIRLAGEFTTETSEPVESSALLAIRVIANKTQRALEERWADVTEHYTALRLHCVKY